MLKHIFTFITCLIIAFVTFLVLGFAIHPLVGVFGGLVVFMFSVELSSPKYKRE